MATAVMTSHIWLDDRGVAWIGNTNMKIIEIALDMLAYGLSPEDIRHQHYDGLSMAEIHSALAYYYDHQAEMDAEIDRQYREAEALRAQSQDSPLRQKLRALGKLP